MSWIWTAIVGLSIVFSAVTGNSGELSSAALQGAKNGVDVAFSIAGALCLWSGVGKLLEKSGVTAMLARVMRPLIGRLFPSSRSDTALAGHLSANICANLMGLGNAATPMGICAAKRLSAGCDGIASDELCRLVVLNTASIQLIPGSVIALRSALGSAAPFDILPAVWASSICSAGLGLGAAWLLGKAANNA